MQYGYRSLLLVDLQWKTAENVGNVYLCKKKRMNKFQIEDKVVEEKVAVMVKETRVIREKLWKLLMVIGGLECTYTTLR